MTRTLGVMAAVLYLAWTGCARVKTPIGIVGNDAGPIGTGIGGAAPDQNVDGGRGSIRGFDAGAGGAGTVATTFPPEWNCGTNCFVAPELPTAPPPADSFTGPVDPNAANRPTLVYPLAGSMHAINLMDITFQWRRGNVSQTMFRIRFAAQSGAPAARFDFYVVCKQPATAPPPPEEECTYALPPGAWLAMASQNRGAEVAIEIAGTDGKGGAVARSDSTAIAFSPDPVAGGLYYWSTALRGTYRLLFGARKALPFIVPQSPSNPTTCAGCHAVSRNGAVIAFSAGDQADDAYLRTAATSNPDVPLFLPTGIHDSATVTLNPEGSLALVSYASKLELRDTRDGRVISTVNPDFLGTERQAYHPDWSADGKDIAVTLSAAPDSQWAVRTGQIAILPFNGGAFGPALVVAPSGADFNFYPSWSPDGKWIAFASAPAGMNKISYDQADARLRMVSRAGGGIYELGRATQGIGKTSTWPRFAPYVQGGGSVMFLTFNSKMDYGFLLKNSVQPQGGEPQLWMSAIDVRKLSSGDASYAPVWLPFQDITQRNHLGFWTEEIGCRVQSDGASVGCGEGETCQSGRCVGIIF